MSVRSILFTVGWFFVVLLFPTGLIPQTNAFIHIWQIELPAAVLLAGCCLFLILRPPSKIEFSVEELRFVVVPIVLFIFWSALSMLWASSWRSAGHHTVLWCLYLIFYLIVRQIAASTNGIQLLLVGLTASIVIFCIAAITGYISLLIFNGSNQLGMLAKQGEQIVTILPLLLVTTVTLEGRKFWMATIAITLMWLLIFCTAGRINLFLFTVAIIASTTVILWKALSARSNLPAADNGNFGRSVRKLVVIGVAVVSAPIAIQMFAYVGEGRGFSEGTLQRFSDEAALTSSNNFRRLMISVSKEMFLEHPLAGIGADNFGSQANEYRKIYATQRPDDLALSEAEDTIPERAHNELLQIAAELGIVGVAIVLWFGCGMILLAFRSLRDIREPDASVNSLLGIAAILGLAMFGASSLISSFSFRLIQNGFVFFFVLAVAYTSRESKVVTLPSEEPRPKIMIPNLRFGAAAGLLACLLMIGYWGVRVTSLHYMTKANYTRDIAEAEHLYSSAERLDDENADAFYYHGMRLFQETRFDEAASSFERAIRLGRARSADFSYLASAQSLAGDDFGGERTLAEAFQMYPHSPFVMARYAHAMQSNGKIEPSEAMLEKAKTRNIREANSWWTLLNEGSDPAATRAFKDPQNYAPLMDLRPLNALYAYRDERKIRFPDESIELFESGLMGTP